MTAEKLDHGANPGTEQTERLAERFADQLREEHPGALASLDAAVSAGADCSQVSWLRQGAGPGNGMEEAREIIQGARGFMEGLNPKEKEEAAWAVSEAMSLPLHRAITDLQSRDPGPGTPEDWRETVAPAGVNLKNAVNHQSSMLRHNLTQDEGERWEENVDGLRRAAGDLELLTSGKLDQDHFSRTLMERDPALAEELHTVRDDEKTWRWPTWMEGTQARRRAETIFDAFQESVEGMSIDYRKQASFDVADAMGCQLDMAVEDTGNRKVAESHRDRNEEFQDTLTRGDREAFAENLREMGRTARMVDRHRRHGTENPSRRQIQEYEEARETPQKRAEVFNGYLAERDPELAGDVRGNWPELTPGQAETIFDTFQEERHRLDIERAWGKTALELCQDMATGLEGEILAADLDYAGRKELERARNTAVRNMTRGLSRNNTLEYGEGVDGLERVRRRLQETGGG